jgi:hypothetical protein
MSTEQWTKKLEQWQEQGKTLQWIADTLNANGTEHPTKDLGSWSTGAVSLLAISLGLRRRKSPKKFKKRGSYTKRNSLVVDPESMLEDILTSNLNKETRSQLIKVVARDIVGG